MIEDSPPSHSDRLNLLMGNNSELRQLDFPSQDELDSLLKEVVRWGFAIGGDRDEFRKWYGTLFNFVKQSRETDNHREKLRHWSSVFWAIDENQLKIAFSPMGYEVAEKVINLGSTAAVHMTEAIVNSELLNGPSINPEIESFKDYQARINGYQNMHGFLHKLQRLGFRRYRQVELTELMTRARGRLRDTARAMVVCGDVGLHNNGILAYLRNFDLIRSCLVLYSEEDDLQTYIIPLVQELGGNYLDLENGLGLPLWGLNDTNRSMLSTMRELEMREVKNENFDYDYEGRACRSEIGDLQAKLESRFSIVSSTN